MQFIKLDTKLYVRLLLLVFYLLPFKAFFIAFVYLNLKFGFSMIQISLNSQAQNKFETKLFALCLTDERRFTSGVLCPYYVVRSDLSPVIFRFTEPAFIRCNETF